MAPIKLLILGLICGNEKASWATCELNLKGSLVNRKGECQAQETTWMKTLSWQEQSESVELSRRAGQAWHRVLACHLLCDLKMLFLLGLNLLIYKMGQ